MNYSGPLGCKMEQDREKGGSSERYRVGGGPSYKSSVLVGGRSG